MCYSVLRRFHAAIQIEYFRYALLVREAFLRMADKALLRFSCERKTLFHHRLRFGRQLTAIPCKYATSYYFFVSPYVQAKVKQKNEK